MFIVTINSPKEFDYMLEAQPDAVILAWPHLSLRQNPWTKDTSREAQKKWRADVQRLKDAGIQVYVNALKMMMEDDLEEADQMMKFCKELDIDGIYIADEGYISLADEYGLRGRLIYQPETLVVNAMDVHYYRSLGLPAVCLAHELSLEQVKEIAAQADGLEVLVQGQYSWMYSRRPLVTNYLEELKEQGYLPELSEDQIPVDSAEEALNSGCSTVKTDSTVSDQKIQRLILVEANRKDRMPVEESEAGTVVFSSEPMNSLGVIRGLQDAGIERFRIDTYMEEEQYGKNQLELYRKVLNVPENQEDAQVEKMIEAAKAEGNYVGSDHTWYNQTTLRKED